MTQATTTTTTRRGFKAPCPYCSEAGSLSIHVEDVNTLTCGNCDNEITTADVHEIIGQWQALLTWLRTAPEIGGDR